MDILQERKDRTLAHKRHQLEVGKTVMHMFMAGNTNKEIADAIEVTENTVRMVTKDLKRRDYYGYKKKA